MIVLVFVNSVVLLFSMSSPEQLVDSMCVYKRYEIRSVDVLLPSAM